ALVWAKVLEFAALNGVVDDSPDGEVRAWYVGSGYINREQNPLDGTPRVGAGVFPAGATGVAVTLVATDTTTFMRVVGQQHISAAGEAAAMAGRVTALGGSILPIGVPEEIVDERDGGGMFRIMGNGDFCDLVGCDPETDNPPQAQAGWLQLGHVFNMGHPNPGDARFRTFIYSMAATGCSHPPIEYMDSIGVEGWAAPGCDYPYFLYAGDVGDMGGDWVAGGTGAIAGGVKAVQDRIDIGEAIAVVPVFDRIYVGACSADENCMETVFEDKEPPGGWFTGASKYYYHIIGFVTVRLEAAHINDKSIEAEFISLATGEGVISPSSGVGSGTCQPSELISTVLWE
ncbi:MAG: hypothetical protein MUQ10_17300, partial [Anaerolineae bacterium]|nr:hypothetical protein [Anaerolineae bacterium]